MDWRRKLLFLVLLCSSVWSSGILLGQTTPWRNLRQHWVATTNAQPLDSLTVIPYTLQLTWPDGSKVDSAAYQLYHNQLSWQEPPQADSVWARYRVLPVQLERQLVLLDTTQLTNRPDGLVIGSYDPYARDDELFSGNQLNYTGSFSRGLSFGNRQDLVLNSSFNLQLGGELGDGIRITAAITDENLPIQPEGNTRQLRDFDRIFIRLEKDESQLTAGDYELRNPEGYFMQYFKKLEGATFQTQQTVGEQGVWRNQASVAVARGQFRRQLIEGQEGNQGPYKLQGNAGERFLIILAGTERVLLDGQPLQRGRDADYTIDYNQGEVTFTPKRLITKDSRITIEFEYADQRYLRTLYAASSHYESDRWEAYANLYSQQDSKNSTGDLTLSEDERALLRDSGDALSGVFLSTIDTVGNNGSQRATYQLVDTTLLCGGRDTSFQLLRFSPEGNYVASFIFVGNGGGDYVLDLSETANERVFRYVAPDPTTCQPQGDYRAARQLAAPEQQRLLTVGGRYRSKQGTISAEVGYSQEDLNRFSRLDADDDQGLATRFDWTQRWLPTRDSTSHWQLSSTVAYERLQQNFRFINPYRSPEFLRDWGLATVNGLGVTEAATENLGEVGFALSKAERASFSYRWSFFDRAASYSGNRHSAALSWQQPSWTLKASNSWLSADTPNELQSFIRPYAQLQKTFPKLNSWTLNVEGQAERNERQAPNTAILNPASFYFQRYVASLASPQQEKWQISTSVRSRTDFAPVETDFVKSTIATEGEVSGNWQPSKKWRTTGSLSYRSLEVQNSELTQQTSGETLLGRIDMTATLWKNSFRSNTTYEIGSGQEPRIEFVYLFVGAGQGQYIWLDSLYNNDGKIQPNEMEIAPFPDIADHVRVSIFTDDFIRTDNVTLNQSIQIDPARAWRDSQREWQKFIARLEEQSSLSINRKVRAAPNVQTWNPLQLDLPDSALVAVTANQRHVVFFNRRSTKYDIQLERLIQSRRLVPTTGFESRINRTTTLRTRWNITDAATLRLALSRRWRAADSEFFNNKDYALSGYSWEPSINYQPGNDFRLQAGFTWLQETNQLIEGNQEALQRREVSLDANYQRWLRLNVSYIDIDLAGDPHSPVGFVLLNGLQIGRNWLWNTTLTRQLGRYLQMTLSYEGRQTGESQVVHVGRAQVTAIF